MKKDLSLVLCFHEGQGFAPKDHHSVVLSAKIDNKVLLTDPVPLTSDPKFFTEVSWTVDSQTLRRYKLSQVPVRVECFSLDEKDGKHLLGYIILKLKSVVLGLETDPKWNKLLGGNLQQSKVPPQLLLSLNLYPVKPDAKVTGDPHKMLHNGNIHSGQYAMTSVPNSVVGNTISQQNGASNAFQDANMNSSHFSQVYQDALQMAMFGAAGKMGAPYADRSQLHISSSQKEILQTPSSNSQGHGKTVSASSKSLDDEYAEALDIDLDDDEEEEDEDDICNMFKIEEVHSAKMEEDVSHSQEGSRTTQKKRMATNYDRVSETSKASDFAKCNGQLEFKNKNRFAATSPLERARGLLDGITNGGDSKGNLSARSRVDDDYDIYAGIDGDEDEGLDSGFQSKVGGKKMAEGWHPSQSSAYSNSGKGLQGAVGFNKTPSSTFQSKTETRRLSDPLGESFIGKKHDYIPLKSREVQSGGVHSSSSRRGSVSSDHLVPRLNHEGGFIQIGPPGDPQEESFEFSATIVFAKNLDQVVPKDFAWSPNSGTCFTYSLMGCRITSDPITDLHNPDFLAERVAANIHVTASNLSTYFKKNSDFPIHLVIGDLCLASTSISLAKFEEFDSKVIAQKPLTSEGWHELVSVVTDAKEVVPGKEPVIGVVIQLCSRSGKVPKHHIPPALSHLNVSSDSEPDLYSYVPHQRRKSSLGKLRNMTKFDTLTSSSSDSSEDEIIPAGKRRRAVSPRKLHHKEKSLLSELHALRELSDEGNKLRRHLFKAALEVESWKEDQQALFLKQWSAREAELQRHLSDEWKTRINSIESSLHSRLAQSDALNRKLTLALSELSIREKKLSVREERVRKLQEYLEIQKSEQDAIENETFEGRLNQKERRENNALLEELRKEKERREDLENEVIDLKATSEQLQMPPHHQYYELKNQITSLKRDKEMMADQLATALKKKQYYKVQWVRGVSELHHLKKSHMKEMESVRYEMEMSSPEPPYVMQAHQYKRNRPRSHTVDGSVRSKQRHRKEADAPFQANPSFDRHFRGGTTMDPGSSWMDQGSVLDAEGQAERRVSGGASSSRIEPERTVMDAGKGGRRVSMGAPSEFEDFLRRRNSEEQQLEKLLMKESNVWKGADK